MCFTVVLEYLKNTDAILLQQINKFFYQVQMPRCLVKLAIKPQSTRLHLLNQDYIVVFDLLTWQKSKRRVKNLDFQSMWNQ